MSVAKIYLKTLYQMSSGTLEGKVSLVKLSLSVFGKPLRYKWRTALNIYL